MFNLAVYGIVDKVLYQAHILRAGLVMSLDMNDFVHVDLLYLPWRASRSGLTLHSATELLPTRVAPSVQEHPTPEKTMHPHSTRPTVAPSTEPNTRAEDFNVNEYIIDRTFPIGSAGEMRINQYGSMFEHVVIHPHNSSNEDYTPPNPDASHQSPSVRVYPTCQPSPIEKDVEYDQDVDM